MSRLPFDIFLEAEDINYAMAYRWLKQQRGGPIYQNSEVNYLIILANLSIAAERFSRDSRGPEVMEDIMEQTREGLWLRLGIKESSPEHRNASSRTIKQTPLAKQCRIILRGLHKAHDEFDHYPIDVEGQWLLGNMYSRRELAEITGKKPANMNCPPKKQMVFFR
ncbi:hypothetical protein PG993_007420 [Apiospora rasikravindrae]|uniref:Uncharacterized protein n=1 Tax=Apiospora rasikravindrae TaxID=990691 RepID=A0ABR1SXG7_9PEZI